MATPGTLTTGTTVEGYRIERVLGHGGMGVVYEATDRFLGNRPVALKIIAGDLSGDPHFRERFKREAEIQATLEHPHIVTVYRAGESEHGLFIAMRLIRGPNLKDVITKEPLDPGRVARLLGQVADALDAAHELGLIHRDIKPNNILIDLRRDHAFLADFGITKARDRGALTRTGQLVGTLDYISPEQILGNPMTERSDVYSLAAVLYECLTGLVPFPKASEVAVLYAHVSDAPPSPTAVRPELPAAVDAVIAKAMAKEPGERPGSASELVTSFARALGARSAPSAQIGTSRAPDGKQEDEQAGAPDTGQPAQPERGVERWRRAGPTRLGRRKGPAPDHTNSPSIMRESGSPGTPATRRTGDSETSRGEAGQAPGSGRRRRGSKTKLARGARNGLIASAPGQSAPAARPPDGLDGEDNSRSALDVKAKAEDSPAPSRGRLQRARTAVRRPRPDPARRIPRAALLGSSAVLLTAIAAGAITGERIQDTAAHNPAEAPEASAAPARVASGAVTLLVPPGWAEIDESPQIPGLTLDGPIGLAARDGRATLFVGRIEPNWPTFLPRTFVRQVKPSAIAERTVIRIGAEDLQGFRYADAAPRGMAEDLILYAVPGLTRATIIACLAAGSSRRSALAECESVVASVALADARPYSLEPSRSYAQTLNRTLARLDEDRRGGAEALTRAVTRAAQAKAAHRIAKAYATAIDRLRGPTLTPYERPAHEAIMAALRQTGNAYRALGSAASPPGEEERYRRARQAIAASERNLVRAIRGLAAVGFRIQ